MHPHDHELTVSQDENFDNVYKGAYIIGLTWGCDFLALKPRLSVDHRGNRYFADINISILTSGVVQRKEISRSSSMLCHELGLVSIAVDSERFLQNAKAWTATTVLMNKDVILRQLYQ